jgi:hypothetical protein
MIDLETIKLVIELLVTVFVTPLACVLWWMLRKLVADVRDLERALADYKLHVSENFSTKNDLTKAIEQFSRSVDAVFMKLERIEDKLDMKADKP